jgi:hypothetical protein
MKKFIKTLFGMKKLVREEINSQYENEIRKLERLKEFIIDSQAEHAIKHSNDFNRYEEIITLKLEKQYEKIAKLVINKNLENHLTNKKIK